MNALVAAVAVRCTGLLAGLTLDDPNNAGSVLQVPVYQHALPIAETPEDKAEQSPYLVVRLVGLEESAGKYSPVIRLLGEVYTADGVAEGMTDLLAMIARLRPLAERGPGNITGYKIMPPIVWQMGDKDTGNQPHPFYQFQADLRFAGV